MADPFGRAAAGFATGLQVGTQARGQRVAERQGDRELALRELRLKQQQDQAIQEATGKRLDEIISQQDTQISTLVKQIENAQKAGKDTTMLRERGAGVIELFNRTRRATGTPEINANILENVVASTPSPAEAGVAAGQQASGQAAAEFGFVQELPPELQAQFQQRLGFDTPQNTDSFFRALNEHDRLAELVATGQATSTDRQRLEVIKQRVQSLAQNQRQTFSVETIDPNTGAVSRFTVGPGQGAAAPQPTQGGQAPAAAGTFGALPATQQQRQSERITSIEDSVALIDELLTDIPENPQDFGATASLRSGVQTGVSILTDIAEGIASVTGGAIDLDGASDLAKETFGEQSVFDPDLPRLQAVEQRLATALFKLRLQTAGVQGRSLDSLLKRAESDVRLRGLTSSEDIVSRLQAIKSEFQAEREKITRGLTGQGQGGGGNRMQEIEGVLSGGGLAEEEELRLRLELEELRSGAIR